MKSDYMIKNGIGYAVLGAVITVMGISLFFFDPGEILYVSIFILVIIMAPFFVFLNGIANAYYGVKSKSVQYPAGERRTVSVVQGYNIFYIKGINIFCPKCNTDLGSSNLKFCPNCGYKIDADEGATETDTPESE